MQSFSRRLGQLLHHESAAGILLVVAAAIAIVLDNSRLEWLYDRFLSTPVSVRIGALALDKPLLLWINDGLMAVFFFLVGMEIKREVLDGELASWQQAALPGVAAFGGMIVPALVYAAINAGNPVALRGWAIPSATDIAFAVGVLTLLGSRVPAALKVFLMALAVLDDLGAIIVIAVFYTADLSQLSLVMATICVAVLVGFNCLGIARTAPYLLVGTVLWVCVLKSGVHATLAGVITALAIPLRLSGAAGAVSPLHRLIEALHPWVAFGILPLFAFANAGISLANLSLAKLAEPIPLGIALGLFFGKQIGVFGFALVAVRAGFGQLPPGVTWLDIYGVSLLAGIGFTMSLFIGTLAFPGGDQAVAVRFGVLTGSLLSAILGYAVLRYAPRPQTAV